MVVESATLDAAVAAGINLNQNAFLLIHGWTAGPLLLEFAAKLAAPLCRGSLTAAQVAAETGAKEGPLAIVLRTCSALGYLDFDPSAGTYSAVQGSELDELLRCLGPDSEASKALSRIYTEACPPFKLPSEQATVCLDAWRQHRPSWKNSKSKALAILMDGMVLAPLLTSITYFARWDEQGLDLGKDKALERLDFSKLDASSRVLLGEIFEELGVGSVTAQGTVSVSSKGSLAIQRVYSYYVPTSYSPLLARFRQVLYEEPGWGFTGDMDEDEGEIHVERTLNVVGSGAQHQTLFKDLMRHVHEVFADENFEAQPEFVVDTGCGDGHLLQVIYEHVKNHTPRGKVLDKHPLTMVGVDFNEKSRIATACNLGNHDVPHKVIAGDIGKPSSIMAQLKRKKVDPNKSLHVRSFLDHDRPYIAPKNQLEEGSAVAAFAKAQMADFVHLNKEGEPVPATELFASLVEHMARWGDALEGSFGLCMLEVMQLDVPTTKRFMNDCVSFHFDIVQCLSRQYMISAVAFAMGGAMAGLFPTDFKSVQNYPEQGNYCRMMNQHLVRRPYKIRFAELADLPTLEKLEAKTWAQNLRAAAEVLRKRLETSPTSNLVCEVNGEVVAVLYMQRVSTLEAVQSEKFMQISDSHTPGGRILQLIAISADPEVSGMHIGTDLRSFALLLARLDPTVDSVIGVTRCADFAGRSGSLQDYVDGHVSGLHSDKTLGFHTGYGASVLRLVPDFRPEDTENSGTGVLIQYQVKAWVASSTSSSSSTAKGTKTTGATSEAPGLEILAEIMEDIGYTLDRTDLSQGFFSYGIDSLELVRIRNRLIAALGRELPATLLLDFPNVQDLADQLDKERGLGATAPQAPEGETEGGSNQEQNAETGWASIDLEQMKQLQEKLNKLYALPQNQKKLGELAAKYLPDKSRYLSSIEPVMAEVEGPVLLAFGLADDMKPATVQKARKGFTPCVKRLGRRNPEVLERDQELLKLLKLAD
ncbi:unnamed protein product [Polarella glacialis]|uniref:Carrier domain-containing protein n=1 Tax=Polarella glacialis TaxID=89957 RepID=A0A813JQZ5_POLGL|nr:unnamed protein product [Polarella glacialis]